MDRLVVLLLGWTCVCCGYCALLTGHQRWAGITMDYVHRKVQRKEAWQNTMTGHMLMLYTRSLREPPPPRNGNTVRSFEGHPGTINKRQLQIFNLTSLTKSEDVLSATLHYYVGDLHNGTRRCDGLSLHVPLELTIWSLDLRQNTTRCLDYLSAKVPCIHRDLKSWHWSDITHVVNNAKHRDTLLIGISINPQPWKTMSPDLYPYILVRANDSAISESETVVSSLQRRKVGLLPRLKKLGLRRRNGSARHRPKRQANVLLPLQNNELPGPEYPYEMHTWDETNPYDPVENKPGKRARKKPRKNTRDKNPLLQFDEQTIKKARKKQWNEPKNCARRYLKVDFADIGWSEWIISPKSFDAYYCSGSCQFPMPKSSKPSNHATIQSIVRAVGVVQGIPEPCCVPEKMSPLSILFLDEDKNVVLKVYPNMTVDSCACR